MGSGSDPSDNCENVSSHIGTVSRPVQSPLDPASPFHKTRPQATDKRLGFRTPRRTVRALVQEFRANGKLGSP